ncbi:MAG: DUF4032 domain-containing protein [Ilumatobacteraceae bacterium]
MFGGIMRCDVIAEGVVAAARDVSLHVPLVVRLEAAEIFHQLLEHRWYLAERLGHDVTLEEALRSYLDEILATSPDERLHIDEPTAEIPRTEPVP